MTITARVAVIPYAHQKERNLPEKEKLQLEKVGAWRFRRHPFLVGWPAEMNMTAAVGRAEAHRRGCWKRGQPPEYGLEASSEKRTTAGI